MNDDIIFYYEAPLLHTHGIWALDDPIAYDFLYYAFRNHPLREKWFLQSDSQNMHKGDKSALFIEFLGQNLTEEQALAQCENIANFCAQLKPTAHFQIQRF